MKKILVLAFVSAAFLFGCSADGSFTASSAPPEWKGGPASTPSGGGGGGGNNNNKKYCYLYDYHEDEYVCYLIPGRYIDTESECENDYYGDIVNFQRCQDKADYIEQ